VALSLSDEQKFVSRELLKFNKPIQTLGGYAGTGKSTVISHLMNILPNWKVCAFTGKAANVLRKKGVPATTIHSLIYKPLVDDKGDVIPDENGNPTFVLTSELDAEGIIIDEASMISRELYEDLVSFNLPIIFVGDHGQLEPVGQDMNLMAHPDFTLETIHRNAGEVARFCEFIRRGYRPAAFQTSFEGKVHFLNRFQAEQYITDVDQIICAFNRTRVQINKRVRAKLGMPEGDSPVVGDRIMCLKNNNQIGLFNGMQGTVDFIYSRKNRMHFRNDEGNVFDINFDPKQFNEEQYKLSFRRGDPDPFDFAYCITVHKSQGSEWNKLMVFEQRGGNWDHRRWSYTAASRAEDEIYWIVL